MHAHAHLHTHTCAHTFARMHSGLNGASIESSGVGSLDASTSMVQSTALEGNSHSRPDSPEKRAQSAEAEAAIALLKRGRIPKDKVKDYGPPVDAATGKVNTAALIASQGFAEKIPTSYGAAVPVPREFTKIVNYASKKYNAFSMVRACNIKCVLYMYVHVSVCTYMCTYTCM